MSAWRDTLITIIVEVDGEQPLQLTHTFKDLHKDTPHVGIWEMMDAFRCYSGGEEELAKPKNEKWRELALEIKRVPFSQWAGIKFEDRKAGYKVPESVGV